MKVIYVLSIFYVLSDAEEVTDDFTALAIGIRKFHGASGIFILYDNHKFGFKEERILIQTIRSYSNQNSMSQAIAYDDFEKAHERRGKALFALTISTRKSLDRAINATKRTAISAHPWLLFVMRNISGFDCKEPGKDFFKLRMDTKMMAKCEGDNVLRRYHGIFDNQTEVFNLTEWNSEKNKLQFASKKSMAEPKTNFKGITLNVVETTREFDLTHSKLADYQRALMQELASLGNFRINVVSQNDLFGYFDNKARRWIGLVEAIIGKKADTSMLLSSVSADRTGVVDFVMPILTSQCFLFARLPDNTQVPWAAYFKAFDKKSLMTVGIFIILFSVLLSFLKTKHRNITTRTFLDNFINVWGILNQQGTSDDTSTSSIRVLYFVILVMALILNTIFSATIASYIAALEIQLPFSSYEEFVSDSSYKLALLKYSSDRALIEKNDTLITPLKFRLKDDDDLPATPLEAFQQLCDEEKTALYSDGLDFDDLIPKPWSKCIISRVKINRVQYLSLVLPKNSPYTASMNYLVSRLRELGILSRLKNRHLRMLAKTLEVEPNVISFEEIIPILAILMVGAVAALLVYFLEVIVHQSSRTAAV